MDPTATLTLLCEAIEANDFDAAHEHVINLKGWMDRGGVGFIPENWGSPLTANGRAFYKWAVEQLNL